MGKFRLRNFVNIFILVIMDYNFKFLVLTCLFFGVSHSALAQQADLDLKQQAIMYASQADALNIYCEKDSTLADDLITKFSSDDQIDGKELNTLKKLKEVGFSAAYETLKKDVPKCKDVSFMMSRLELMRKLRDVSYRLNGVDPETIPQPNMPALEDLLPPPRDVPVLPLKL